MPRFVPPATQFCIGKRNRRNIVVPYREPRRQEDIMAEKARCTRKAECAGCQYAAHGFICYSNDGTCLKNSYK